MIKKLSHFLIILLFAGGILYATHSYVLLNVIEVENYNLPLYSIYLFHAFVALIVFSLINYQYHKGNKMIFNWFMGGTLLKIILSVIFLLPIILNKQGNYQTDIFNFFIPYFLFLALEIYSILQLINTKKL